MSEKQPTRPATTRRCLPSHFAVRLCSLIFLGVRYESFQRAVSLFPCQHLEMEHPHSNPLINMQWNHYLSAPAQTELASGKKEFAVPKHL